MKTLLLSATLAGLTVAGAADPVEAGNWRYPGTTARYDCVTPVAVAPVVAASVAVAPVVQCPLNTYPVSTRYQVAPPRNRYDIAPRNYYRGTPARTAPRDYRRTPVAPPVRNYPRTRGIGFGFSY